MNEMTVLEKRIAGKYRAIRRNYGEYVQAVREQDEWEQELTVWTIQDLCRQLKNLYYVQNIIK